MCNLRRLLCVFFILVVAEFAVVARTGKPQVYRKIELNKPQMFVDDYLVGNRYNEKYISACVPHVLHQGERLPNPILTKDDDKPWERRGIGGGYVFYDAYEDIFRMYYIIYNPEPEKKTPDWNL